MNDSNYIFDDVWQTVKERAGDVVGGVSSWISEKPKEEGKEKPKEDNEDDLSEIKNWRSHVKSGRYKGKEIFSIVDKGHLIDKYLSLYSCFFTLKTTIDQYAENATKNQKYSSLTRLFMIFVDDVVWKQEQENTLPKLISHFLYSKDIRHIFNIIRDTHDFCSDINVIINSLYNFDHHYIRSTGLDGKPENFYTFIDNFDVTLDSLEKNIKKISHVVSFIKSNLSIYERCKYLFFSIIKNFKKRAYYLISDKVVIENLVNEFLSTKAIHIEDILRQYVYSSDSGSNDIYVLYKGFTTNFNNIINKLLSQFNNFIFRKGYDISSEMRESNVKLKLKDTKVDLLATNLLDEEKVNIIKRYGKDRYLNDVFEINNLISKDVKNYGNFTFNFILKFILNNDFEFFYRSIFLRKKEWMNKTIEILKKIHAYKPTLNLFSSISNNTYDVEILYDLINIDSNKSNFEKTTKRLNIIFNILKVLHDNYENDIRDNEGICQFLYKMIKDQKYDKLLSLIPSFDIVKEYLIIRILLQTGYFEKEIASNELVKKYINFDEFYRNFINFKNIDINNFDVKKGGEHYSAIKYLITAYAIFSNVSFISQYESEREDKNKILFDLNLDIRFKGKGLRFSVLEGGDIRYLTVGVETECCQRIGGAGEDAVIDSYINGNAGVLILENNGEILSQSYFHYVPNQNGIILDNVEYNRDRLEKLDINEYILSEIYAFYAEYIQRKLDLSYFKCGIRYNKLKNEMFALDSMNKDPREIKSREKYSDFSKHSHLNLLEYEGEIDYKDFIVINNKVAHLTMKGRLSFMHMIKRGLYYSM